jgi:magnesium chelatase subunit I
MEFALHGLAEYSMLSRNVLSNGLEFKDLLDSMLNIKMDFEDEDL